MKKDKNMEKKPEEIKADESIKGRVNHPLSPDALKAIIHNKNTNILNIRVDSYDPINVAKAVEELDPEEEMELFRQIIAGSADARERLAELYLPVVCGLADEY